MLAETEQLRKSQITRLVKLVYLTGPKGKNETALCYSEKRFHDIAPEATRSILNELVTAGVLKRADVRRKTRKYKTESEREKRQIIRYWYSELAP